MTSIRALRAHRQRPVHAALQTDRGRLRYIEDLACAQPQPVHDGAETPSTISLKQASTIAEMRSRSRGQNSMAVDGHLRVFATSGNVVGQLFGDPPC
jgi:hypothetical protein